MNTYAIIDSNGGWLVNLIIWDGETNWTPPEGTYAIKLEGIDITILPEMSSD